MEKNKTPAASTTPGDVWHIDLSIQYDPDALQPYYTNCQVARGIMQANKRDWKFEGIASFDGVALVPPREGQDVIPYLLYHLDEIKGWLMEEHVRAAFNAESLQFSPAFGLPALKAPSQPPE